jgi:hypothetical protein
MKDIDPLKLKKKKLLLLQSIEELNKNAEDLWKTVSKQKDPGKIDFNYFIGKYLKYVKIGKKLYGKKFSEYEVTISDSEYQKLSGLKKIITEMGLVIVFMKNDVGNLLEENKRLKKQLIKYKKQAMAIQRIT